jgi:hypothetical protein
VNALAALQPFVRSRHDVGPARERCGVCAEPIDSDGHAHLVDLERRALLCACPTCARLFARPDTNGGRYQVVPTRVLVDPAFHLRDTEWAALGIPVRLAFIFYNTGLARWVALYPSPGGAAETDVPPAAVEALAAATPLIAEVAPDVEALLVHGRPTARPETFLVPIDACYRLVGEVRRSWRGMSGGDLVWPRIDSFFDELRLRARPFAPGGAE